MKIIVALALIVSSFAHAGATAEDRPKFWNLEWEFVTTLLRQQIGGGLTTIHLNSVLPTSSDMNNLGEVFAMINVLAQGPCRRNEVDCRAQMDQVIAPIFRRVFADVPPRTPKHAVLQRRYLDLIKEQVQSDRIASHTAELAREWRTDVEGRVVKGLQLAVIAATSAIGAGLAVRYGDVGVGPAALGAIAAAGAVGYVVYDRLPWTTRFRPGLNVVLEPVTACASALAPQKIGGQP